MLVRQMKCLQCGAPLDVVPDALVVFCEYCGSFLGLETGKLLSPEGLVRAYEEGVAAFVAPSRLQARQAQLMADMEDAKAQRDRAAYAALARELVAVSAAQNPLNFGSRSKDPARLAQDVRQGAKMMELLAFDIDVAEAQQKVTRATAGLVSGGGDPVQAARRVLDANREFYSMLHAHPEYPMDGGGDLERVASEATRGLVESMAGVLPPGAAARILRDVMGAVETEGDTLQCSNCGAAMSLDDLAPGSRCPFCGGAVRVHAEDPWLTQLLAAWEVVRRSSPRADHAMGVLQVALSSHHTGGQVPSVDRVMEFLRRAVPYTRQEEMKTALGLLESAYAGEAELSTLLRDLGQRLAQWTPTAAEPERVTAGPQPARSRDSTGDVGDPSEDPWVAQAVAQWRLSRSNLSEWDEAALLGQALTPFHLGGSITSAQAMEFFHQAEASYSRERMVQQVQTFQMGFQGHPGIEPFLDDLEKALR